MPFRSFSLTPAETRLAECLLEGMSLRQAAASLGVGYETARKTLKSIFEKTGTNRQAQLVLVLAGFGKSQA
jgi:DNA-binding CsgD family transcriptional regulator